MLRLDVLALRVLTALAFLGVTDQTTVGLCCLLMPRVVNGEWHDLATLNCGGLLHAWLSGYYIPCCLLASPAQSVTLPCVVGGSISGWHRLPA